MRVARRGEAAAGEWEMRDRQSRIARGGEGTGQCKGKLVPLPPLAACSSYPRQAAHLESLVQLVRGEQDPAESKPTFESARLRSVATLSSPRCSVAA